MMSVEVNTTDASAERETLVSAVAIAGAPDFVRNGAGVQTTGNVEQIPDLNSEKVITFKSLKPVPHRGILQAGQ